MKGLNSNSLKGDFKDDVIKFITESTVPSKDLSTERRISSQNPFSKDQTQPFIQTEPFHRYTKAVSSGLSPQPSLHHQVYQSYDMLLATKHPPVSPSRLPTQTEASIDSSSSAMGSLRPAVPYIPKHSIFSPLSSSCLDKVMLNIGDNKRTQALKSFLSTVIFTFLQASVT